MTQAKVYTAENLTNDEIKSARDRACECRPGPESRRSSGEASSPSQPRRAGDDADERLPIRSGEHAAIHDCDDHTFDLCLIALGANPYHSPRSTTEALAMQLDARARIAEILNDE